MSDQTNAITIHILDKQYMIACPEAEREELIASARFLDERMKETRDGGKVLGAERMAVMTALNIVHEYLQQRREKDELERSVSESVRQLQGKISAVLGRLSYQEALD